MGYRGSKAFAIVVGFVFCQMFAFAITLGAPALAQQYPARAVRVVVAAPPGGLTDIIARSVSQYLHEKLGQPFVVENISGANSAIGATTVARAAPAPPGIECGRLQAIHRVGDREVRQIDQDGGHQDRQLNRDRRFEG